jgi:methylmalonyl-CoA/ethylmalonyl-CoA epimerase
MVIKINFGKIHHIAYVYKDGEAALKEFQSQFGVEEFEKIDMVIGRVTRFMIGNLQVDLMEPRELGSVFNKFLENGNFGLHHIAYLVDNIDEKIKELKSKGFKRLLGGIIPPQTKFEYFDTTNMLGHVIEFIQPNYTKKKKP